jgi:hypothetical protein
MILGGRCASVLLSVRKNRGKLAALPRNKCVGEAQYGWVGPVVAGFGGQAGEGPVADAVWVEVEEIGEVVDSVERVRTEDIEIVEEVLGYVVGGIADERLWVDDEPWLALGAEDIPGMEVSGEQGFSGSVAREIVEEPKSFSD